MLVLGCVLLCVRRARLVVRCRVLVVVFVVDDLLLVVSCSLFDVWCSIVVVSLLAVVARWWLSVGCRLVFPFFFCRLLLFVCCLQVHVFDGASF